MTSGTDSSGSAVAVVGESAPDRDAPPTPPSTAALVLGSGGARGYAHIGVIQVLTEAKIEIVGIAGASMGALVGGMYAAGALEAYTEWAMGLGRFEVLRLMDLSLSSPGAFSGEKVFNVVDELLGDGNIEDLAIPFTAVAVDLLAQREVWFQRGPLGVAIRASSAIPSFFAPVVLNGRVLVDGGVLNPVPVAPIASTPADHVVAVTLNGQDEVQGPPVTESAEEGEEAEWANRLKDAAARWFDADLLAAVRRRLSPELEEAVRARLSSTDAGDGARRQGRAATDESPSTAAILQGSFEVMQGAITRHRLAGYPPDHVISVPKGACSTLDFHRAEEMIDLGRNLAQEALHDLLTTDQHAATEDPSR